MQIDIDIATYEISSDIAKRGNPTNLGSKRGGRGSKGASQPVRMSGRVFVV